MNWTRDVYRWMTVGDWILIMSLVSASLLGIYGIYFWDKWFTLEDDPLYALVRVSNEIVKQIELDDKTIHEDFHIVFNEDNVAIVEVYQGRVRVRDDSTHICPLQYCMNVGWIDRPGQVIVCVPNKMIITIESRTGEQSHQLDAVIY